MESVLSKTMPEEFGAVEHNAYIINTLYPHAIRDKTLTINTKQKKEKT